MTLVVALTSDQGIHILADVVESHRRGDADGIDYPSRPQVEGESKYVISGLTQKIVQVAPGLYYAFSGQVDQGLAVLELIEWEYSRTKSNEAVLDCFGDIFKLQGERYRGLSVLLVACLADNTVIVEGRNCARVDHSFLGRVLVLGSGTEDFLSHASATYPPEVDRGGGNLPTDVERIVFVLSYITKILKAQEQTGFGIDRAWGGGFEYAFQRGTTALQKIENTFFHTLEYEIECGQPVKVRGVGRKVFQYYAGDEFVIVTQTAFEPPKFYFIPKLKRDGTRKRESNSRSRPAEFAYFNFVNKNTGKVNKTLFYNENGTFRAGLRQHRFGLFFIYEREAFLFDYIRWLIVAGEA